MPGTFEAAEERDKGRTILPEASLPEGPEKWSVLKPAPPPERPSLAALLKYCYCNELGDAELFQYLYRNQFVYDHSVEQWFEFDGIRWIHDKIQKAQRSVMEMAELYEAAEYMKSDEAEMAVNKILQQAEEAANSGKEDAKQETEDLKKQAYKLQKALLKKVALLSKRAESLRSTRRVSSVLTAAAQGEESLGISGEEWHGHSQVGLGIIPEPPVLRRHQIHPHSLHDDAERLEVVACPAEDQHGQYRGGMTGVRRGQPFVQGVLGDGRPLPTRKPDFSLGRDQIDLVDQPLTPDAVRSARRMAARTAGMTPANRV